MATVICDLDGTLFCPHLCILTAVKHTLKTLGLPPVTDDLIMSLIGEKYAVFASRIAPGFHDEALLWKIYTQSERDTIKHEARLFDGIPQMLVMLKKEGHKLAVCSNGSMEYIELALHSTGTYDLFDLLVTGNEFHSKSEAVAYILRELPNDCAVVVGDRFHDFRAASDNYLPSIGAAYGYCPVHELGMCTFTAYSAADVHAFIRQITVFSRLFSDIILRPDVRVIGINGVDTSGKTIFSENMQKYLVARGKKASVLHLDDFHNPAGIRNAGPNEIDAYIQNAFDIKKLIDELLKPLKSGQSINKTLECLDLNTDTFSSRRHYEIDKNTYVILEGVLLYREPLSGYIDYKVFLDIGFDEVLRRAEVRDVPQYGPAFLNKYREKYIPIQQWYLEFCLPKSKSDLVIDNRNYSDPRIVK